MITPNIKLGACSGAAYRPKAPTFIVRVKSARTFIVGVKPDGSGFFISIEHTLLSMSAVL